jgi:hypothetical protein
MTVAAELIRELRVGLTSEEFVLQCAPSATAAAATSVTT